MKDQADIQTVDLFQSVKRGRGRPATGQALSNADRQKAYRQRLKSGQVIKLPTVTEMLNMPGEMNQEIESLRQALDRVVRHRDELLRELHQVKDENNQLKNVTVTENQGQGGVVPLTIREQAQEEEIEKLRLELDAVRRGWQKDKGRFTVEMNQLKDDLEREKHFHGLTLRTSESYRKQLDDLSQDHNKLLVKHDRLRV